MVLSVLYLAALARIQVTEPLLGFCAIPLILVLNSVIRIGMHKYGSANRNLGYELHLHRTLDTPENGPDGWKEKYRGVGWEQAMRAWRVIQATVFESLEMHHRDAGESVGRGAPVWYEPRSLVLDETTYYAGSYLRKVVRSLHYLIVLTYVPVAFALAALVQLASGINAVLAVFVGLGCIAAFFWAHRQLRARLFDPNLRRVRMLEGGLLSIHSCAIMWQAVVVGHYRALESALTVTRGRSPQGYTRYLSDQALGICSRIHDIYGWIDGSRSRAFPRVASEMRARVEIPWLDEDIEGAVIDYSFDGSGAGFLAERDLGWGELEARDRAVTLYVDDQPVPATLVPSEAPPGLTPRSPRFGLRVDGPDVQAEFLSLISAQRNN